ncbi:PerC family transcriptional regulator [Citrobacter sp. L55]|uniref:PerC family transcriptional regulator n=1 Tax=Citrobacter sp. L55 TaxID=1981983 RepID=UPI000C78C03F|nr:PerC family transcriptional regulator [Citrobacter sp. L55]PLC64539.1 PerC family transcriptional regulator [Citrobacter sp. L55]
MVEDEVAQKLEAAGLWRRAASRWLDVMQHRKYCFSCAKPINSPEKLDVMEIARAAKTTQERIGLSQPGGVNKRSDVRNTHTS